ncbi:MAG: 30S ribosome-binding factor RbfA [Alphaproteobacteria bacterium]|nr:30S ribosome-binding factor RbfA [Alphaproteobacteria bacterium]
MKKAPTQRQLRVAEEIRHIISDVLMKVDLFDADVIPSLVMVTKVEVSPDFSWATVFVHSIGQQDPQAVTDALQQHKSLFRKYVGRQLKIRITPDIRFRLDTSFDAMEQIENLLRQPEVQKDLKK